MNANENKIELKKEMTTFKMITKPRANTNRRRDRMDKSGKCEPPMEDHQVHLTN